MCVCLTSVFIRSYKAFLPKNMRTHIQNQHFVTRKRIRFRFRKFIQQFSACKASPPDLKLKYVVSLERLQPAFYTEQFHVSEASAGDVCILVSGSHGIRWSRVREPRDREVRRLYASRVYSEESGSDPLCLSQDPQVYCDFSDVIDISVKQGSKDGSVEDRIVSINGRDGQALVRFGRTSVRARVRSVSAASLSVSRRSWSFIL